MSLIKTQTPSYIARDAEPKAKTLKHGVNNTFRMCQQSSYSPTMNPKNNRFGGSLDRCRAPYISEHVRTSLILEQRTKQTHKNKQSSFSLGGGGVLKIGISTGCEANANCWKQDGPSVVASI